MTEQYPPYEPEETYEWDYDDRPKANGKVLWGRVVALAVALFLAFLLGRTTAPSGVPASALKDREDRIEELERENADLELALESEPTPEDTATATPTETPAEDPIEAEGETYVVKRGDTLRGIAQTFCGDASFDDVIAEYNDIADAANISVGLELIIPPDCGE